MAARIARFGMLTATVSLVAIGAAAPAMAAKDTATCASKPVPAAQRIDTPAATTKDTSQVVGEIRKVVPDSVAPEVGAPAAGIRPTLADDGTSAVRARDSLNAVRVARDPARGFSIGTGDGAICVTPTRIGDKGVS